MKRTLTLLLALTMMMTMVVVPASAAIPTTSLTSVTPVGTSGVRLTWSAVSGATAYYVYMGTSSANLIYKQGVASGTSVTVTGLTAGTTYYFAMKVKTAEGNSALSGIKSCTIPVVPNVSLSSAELSGVDAVVLKWPAVSDVEGYYVYMGDSAASVNTYKGYASGTTYTISGLEQGKTYYFGIRGRKTVNGTAQKGNLSNVIACTVPKLEAPAVRLLSVTADSKGNAVLTWEAAAGADAYYVYMGTSASAVTTYKAYASGTSYTVTGLSAGVDYYFGVRSKKTVGDTVLKGDLSNVISFKYMPETKITEIQPLGDKGAKILFNAAPGANGYYIYRGETKEKQTYIGYTANTYYEDKSSTFVNGKQYYYYVQPRIMVNGTAVKSNPSPLRPFVYMTAPAVTVAKGESGKMNITWPAVSGAESYRVYIRRSSDSSFGSPVVVNSASYTADAVADTSYVIAVEGYNTYASEGYTDYKPVVGKRSAETAFTYVDLGEAIPDAIKLSGTNGAKITWNKVDGAEKYYIYRSTKNSASGMSYRAGTIQNYYYDSGLTPGVTYYYCIVPAKTIDGVTYKGPQKTLRPFTIMLQPEVTVTEVNGSTLVSWNAVVGASHYRVYTRTPGGTYGSPKQTNATSITISGTGLIVKVRALNTFAQYTNYSALYGPESAEILPATFSLNGISYAVTENNELSITAGTGASGALTIPTLVEGLKVTAIADNAFMGNTQITSLVIPAGIKSLGISAFEGCTGLRSIQIASSANGITVISKRAFYGCSALTDATLNSFTTKVGTQAFAACTSLKNMR